MSPVSLTLGAAFPPDTGKGRKEPSWKKSERTLARFCWQSLPLLTWKDIKPPALKAPAPAFWAAWKSPVAGQRTDILNTKEATAQLGPQLLYLIITQKEAQQSVQTLSPPQAAPERGEHHPLLKGPPCPTEYQGYLQQCALAQACHTWPLPNYQEL